MLSHQISVADMYQLMYADINTDQYSWTGQPANNVSALIFIVRFLEKDPAEALFMDEH